MSTAAGIERRMAGVHAGVLTVVQYPVLWFTPFLDLPLLANGIKKSFPQVGDWAWPMAVLVELAGIHLGCGWIEARVERQALAADVDKDGAPRAPKRLREAQGREGLALGMFAVYMGTLSVFVWVSGGWVAEVFPLLSGTVIVSASMKMQRQLRQEEAAEAKEERKQAKLEAQALAIRQQAELARAQAQQQAAASALLQDDKSLPTRERVRRYFARDPQGTDNQCASALQVSRQAVQQHRKALAREAQVGAGDRQAELARVQG